MKEIYSKPVVEVEKFQTVEILTVSGPSGTEENIGQDD